MIHTVYSSWSFYVHPFSHCVEVGNEHIIHSVSKMKLIFPNVPNMFVIFHGRIVHNGAESRNLTLSCTRPSTYERLFSYMYVTNEHKKIKGTERTSKKGKRADGAVHCHELTMCYKRGEKGMACKKKCGSVKSEPISSFFTVVYNLKRGRGKIGSPR